MSLPKLTSFSFVWYSLTIWVSGDSSFFSSSVLIFYSSAASPASSPFFSSSAPSAAGASSSSKASKSVKGFRRMLLSSARAVWSITTKHMSVISPEPYEILLLRIYLSVRKTCLKLVFSSVIITFASVMHYKVSRDSSFSLSESMRIASPPTSPRLQP